MRTAMILFTAALAFANGNDRLAEERYKAKYGRYSPAEEARRKAEKNPVTTACFRETTAKPAVLTAADARHKAKFGTTFNRPAVVEVPETIMTCGDVDEPEVLDHRDHACCRLAAVKPAPAETAADARHKAKYGTTFAKAKPAVETAATCGEVCDRHETCKHS